MTTGVVCGRHIKARPPLDAATDAYRMDRQFMQLESQLAALRSHQRHPGTSSKLPPPATPPLSARLTASPAPSPKHGCVPTRTSNSTSGLSSTSSQETAVLHTDASSSSSSSVDSAMLSDKRHVADTPSETSHTTHTSAAVSSPQRHSTGLTRSDQPSSSSTSSSSSTARRSLHSLSEQQSRFRIVKIDSYVDRGRWHCHNFADPPLHDATSTPHDRRHLAADDGHTAPSQIYFIADQDLSSKFYVSTIVYGVHGHPVLDRTVRMSPLQLLRRTSHDDLQPPTPRDDDVTRSRDGDVSRSAAESPSSRAVAETDHEMRTILDQCGEALPVNDAGDHVTSPVPRTNDVMENDPGNPFSGVVMAAHSSMPAIPTSSMTSASCGDVIGRCPVRSMSLCEQADVEMRCHDDDHSATSFSDNGEDANSSSSSSSSTCSIVALDTKIEQAMELVKSHLTFAVREEVNVLKARISQLTARNRRLEMENTLLRQHASADTLSTLQQQQQQQQQHTCSSPTPHCL